MRGQCLQRRCGGRYDNDVPVAQHEQLTLQTLGRVVQDRPGDAAMVRSWCGQARQMQHDRKPLRHAARRRAFHAGQQRSLCHTGGHTIRGTVGDHGREGAHRFQSRHPVPNR